MSSIRVAVAGLALTGQRYLHLLSRSERFTVCAVADSDADARRGLDSSFSGRVFDDYRSLVLDTARTGLDVMVVTLEPFQARDLLTLCAEQGIAVIQKAPFARTVREGRQLLRWFEQRGISLVVAKEGSHGALPCAYGDLKNAPGAIRTVNATIAVKQDTSDWRGDFSRAGGGALLYGAYGVMEWLLNTLGLPDAVYAVCGYNGASGAPRSYDTEDHASIVIRWSGDRGATVMVRRCAQAADLRMTVVGAEGTLTHEWSDAESATRDCKNADALEEITAQIAAASEPKTIQVAELQDHLSVLALMEAAYLSSRTGSPEIPSRFLS